MRTFCLDLRYWYPSRDYRYVKRSAAGLRNRDGDAVSASDLRRMSFALWRYGRSDSATQQAAVMLYVHRLMGDGAPGEVVASALSAGSRKVYRRIVREAGRLAGPLPRARHAAGEAGRGAGGGGRDPGAGRRRAARAGRPGRAGGDGRERLPARVDTGDGGVAKVRSRRPTRRPA